MDSRAESDPGRWNLSTDESTGGKIASAPGGYKFFLAPSLSGNKLTRNRLKKI
jgi:hypothetical protein